MADKNVVRHIFEWKQQQQAAKKSHCTNGNDVVRLLSVYPGLQSCKDRIRNENIRHFQFEKDCFQNRKIYVIIFGKTEFPFVFTVILLRVIHSCYPCSSVVYSVNCRLLKCDNDDINFYSLNVM